jgi:hypothetical protein
MEWVEIYSYKRLDRYYEKNKKDEMGGVCGTHGERR